MERFICKLEVNTTKLNMLIKVNKQNCFLHFLKEYLIYNLFVTAVKGINNVYANRVQNPCFHCFKKLSGTVHTGHYGTPYLGSLKLCDGADLIHGWRFPRNYHMIIVTPEKEKDSCHMEYIDLNDCYNEFLGISTS